MKHATYKDLQLIYGLQSVRYKLFKILDHKYFSIYSIVCSSVV